MTFYTQSTNQVLKSLETSEKGLSESQALKRAQKYGLNELIETEKVSLWKILLGQFSSFLVVLLIGAAILSYLIGEPIDSVVILVVLLVNATVGFIQEYKAEEALAKLKNLETVKAIVMRDGEEREVEAKNLVPGDIVFLNEGSRVPADGRMIDTMGIDVDESMLTGESKSVSKNTKELPEKTALAERFNMVFSGTMVTRGKGKLVVTQTGMETQIGSIAELVQKVTVSSTPLQETLNKLGHILGIISIALAAPPLAYGLATGRDWAEIALTSIALAVSAIPEGLPIVVTVVLAFGVKRMVKKQVLIRKLSAVEALGSTKIICSDKTGTITQNKMEAAVIFSFETGLVEIKGHLNTLRKQVVELAQTALLCNDATLKVGDPTEQALVSLALDLGQTNQLRDSNPRLDELPFTSQNKYMLTLNKMGSDKIIHAKGAPEKILELCKISKDHKRKILEEIEELTQRGMRLLAFARKKVGADYDLKSKNGYEFLGLVGLVDPPRKSVASAIAKCKKAGIRVVMITGDHPITAKTIATQVGIVSADVITGNDIDAMSEKELAQTVREINVFARVSPEHKLQILKALQKQKNFVAMTGDGVNDAPALKEANIGIAVGSGSDLTKEVADMIILDNNFATIVDAVHEGRGIFSNLKKVITFLIAVNFDEVMIIMSSLVLGLPLPLLPIHLLWLNLVTDTLPSLALSVDPYDSQLMNKPPYNPQKEILRGVFSFSIMAALLAFIASFSIFLIDYFVFEATVMHAQTMTFTVTVLFELFFIFIVRTSKRLKDSKPFGNRWLLTAVGIGILLQLLAVYSPHSDTIFGTVHLGLADWIMIIPFALLGVIVIDLARIFNLEITKMSLVPEKIQAKLHGGD